MFIHPSLPFLAAALLTLARGKSPLQKTLHLSLPVLAFMCLYPYFPKDGAYELHRLMIPFLGAYRLILKTDASALFFSAALLFYALITLFFSFRRSGKLELIGHYLSAGACLGALLCGDLLILFLFSSGVFAGRLLMELGPKDRLGFQNALQKTSPLSAALVFFALSLWLRNAQGQTLSVGAQPLDLAGIFLFMAFSVFLFSPAAVLFFRESPAENSGLRDLNLFALPPLLAVYACGRCFPGVDWLLTLGALTATLGLFFACLTQDLRKQVFALLFTQTGLMMTGIGIGSAPGFNGAACLLFSWLLSGTVLLISINVLAERMGNVSFSQLSTLQGKNRDLRGFLIFGIFSLSGIPGLLNYVGFSLLSQSIAAEGMLWTELMIRAVQLAPLLTLGFKMTVPEHRPSSAKKKAFEKIPVPAQIALALGIVLSVVSGWAPQAALYPYLPYKVSLKIFEPGLLLQSLQLVLGAWTFDLWVRRKGLYGK